MWVRFGRYSRGKKYIGSDSSIYPVESASLLVAGPAACRHHKYVVSRSSASNALQGASPFAFNWKSNSVLAYISISPA